ncbi:hypothetical protein DFY40_23530 [Escherichia coli]|nr:hypothetical protein [Escherichia coli]HAJ7076916.1 hypothetical protein [Escherichia coli]
MEHLCCSEVSISPLFRWPNSVCHFNKYKASHPREPPPRVLTEPDVNVYALPALPIGGSAHVDICIPKLPTKLDSIAISMALYIILSSKAEMPIAR